MRFVFPILTLALCLFRTAVWADSPSQPEEARKVFHKTLETFVSDHNKTNAQSGFERSAQLDSHFSAPRFNLGVLAESDERWDEAVKWFQSVIDIDATGDFGRKAHDRLGQVQSLMELSKTDEGRRSIAFSNSLARARLLLKTDRFGAASTEAELASASAPRRFEPWCILADAADKLGKFDDALTDLNKALELAPQEKQEALKKAKSDIERNRNYEHDLTEANSALDKGDYDGAAASFGAAVREKPWKEDCALRQSLALIAGERFDEARDVLKPLLTSSRPEIAREAAATMESLRQAQSKHDQIAAEQKASDILANAQSKAQKMLEEVGATTDAAYRDLGLYCENIPDEARDELVKLIRAKKNIKSVAFSASHGYVILYEKNDYIASGIPENLRNRLDQDHQTEIALNRVTFSSAGGWVLVRGENGWASENVPQTMIDAMQMMNTNHEVITDIAISPGGGWHIVRDGKGYSYNDVPNQWAEAIKEIFGKNEAVTHAAFAPDGNWCLIRESNGYWPSSNLPDKMIVALKHINSAHTKIGDIAFAPNNGWLVLEVK